MRRGSAPKLCCQRPWLKMTVCWPIFALSTILLLLCSTVIVSAQVVIENSLQAVEVVGVETTERMIHLTLKNVSPNNITAIEIAKSAPSADTILSIDSDFGTENVVIAPSADRMFNIDVMPEHPTSKITILAVVFEDGSGEGVPARLDWIKNTRVARQTRCGELLHCGRTF